MTQKPANPLAFPFSTIDVYVCEGMTLHDYFAAHATDADIQGYMWKESEETPVVLYRIRTREEAKYAYADAMLKAREASND